MGRNGDVWGGVGFDGDLGWVWFDGLNLEYEENIDCCGDSGDSLDFM